MSLMYTESLQPIHVCYQLDFLQIQTRWVLTLSYCGAHRSLSPRSLMRLVVQLSIR